MKLVHIQQALFAAYDIRNAMTTDDMYRPTEGESIGECLAEIINTLEMLETELERAKALDAYLMELEGEAK